MEPQSTLAAERAYDAHAAQLYRVAYALLQSRESAEDAVQDAFARYLAHTGTFRDAEHEKAWLFKVASNTCLDMLRYRQKHPMEKLDLAQYLPAKTEQPEILEVLLELPEKYRLVLILYYVEGYRISEIAEIIRKTPSAVKMRLQKGRKLLKNAYGKEEL